jgi:[glutamine synthetase] adenylyltransferase / [glutamine synthetase]-adenylyl-L-tyrosine phosphorylase
MDGERQIRALGPEHPFITEIRPASAARLEITISTYDLPSIFSLLTGVLSSLGMEISSARIRSINLPENPGKNARKSPALPGRGILDSFNGTIGNGETASSFQQRLNKHLAELIPPLLTRTGPDRAATARRTVNEWVASAVNRFTAQEKSVLMPMDLVVRSDLPDYTWIELTAQDSPFFLYSVTTAITLQGLSVERVEINTTRGRILDRFGLLDLEGKKIEDQRALNLLRFSILLTKQFTFFLGEAPAPYAAITRFESLLEELSRSGDPEQWKDLLENPEVLKELAKLLGMSDFLWEDFIRLQYENIIPLLGGGNRIPGAGFDTPVTREDFEYRLQVALSRETSYQGKVDCLNQFKDDEIFKLDLQQILEPRGEFLRFSRNLTRLAEAVAATAFLLAEEHLESRYGRPRTVAGLDVPFTVLGLGKFGGQALGYASDIELICVYSDNGSTDGQNRIPNAEYFDRMVKEAAGIIRTKQEGIFRIDLRLRPHGSAGPHASSLERFTSYYREKARSFERLALVRLRAVAGDRDLGHRVEIIRDEIVYAHGSLNLEELRNLRQRQLDEKNRVGSFNAKFSTGALVDVEYTVQILQAEHGTEHLSLRTPSIRQALEELSRIGIIRADEAQEIIWAYRFLRRLINALRMLRGSARDLFLPDFESDEFSHLARRMGYRRKQDMSPREQLKTEFEERTARVRGFVEHYLGRESLPSRGAESIADLILFPEKPGDLKAEILKRYGFRNCRRGVHNFESLAQKSGNRETFVSVAILAVQELMRRSDPDMALNNWERFATAFEEGQELIRQMLSQPTRINLLMRLFSGSQYLSDILAREPELFGEITDPAFIHRPLTREEFQRRLGDEIGKAPYRKLFIAALRRARKREILRIGTRDICYGAPLEEITRELSLTAESQIREALNYAWLEIGGEGEVPVVMGAFGKLGGMELNYSSDLDLIGILRTGPGAGCLDKEQGRKLMERTRGLLAVPSPVGAGYRVDYRLRPFGRSGDLTAEIPVLEEYYRKKAAPWELQALLKLRLIDPDSKTAADFENHLHPLLGKWRDPKEIVAAIRNNRQAALRTNRDVLRGLRDIKNGPGGIRDIEFLIQGLQLIHAPEYPELICGTTLKALTLLGERELLQPADQRSLNDAYRFFRRIEHFLQLYEDRQIHTLPGKPEELEALSLRCSGLSGSEFLKQVDSLSATVLRLNNEYFALYEA